MKTTFITLVLLTCITLNGQETMPETEIYRTIPEAAQIFTPGTVVSRLIDGLGFRFYWASEGLTEEDLKYEPGNNGRNIRETVEHVYGLSKMILNAARSEPNTSNADAKNMTFGKLREKTLRNMKEASGIMAASDNLENHTIIFKNDEVTASYPFWNALNGPIEDAVWHAGQLVVMRRSAGNPINSNVNVFLGKLIE